MLKLQVVTGNAAGADIAVEEELIIGRTSTPEGRLGEDPEISRQHARVAGSGDSYVVEDLGSMNGTFVNGNRLGAPHHVADGDQIEVGATTLIAHVERPAATPAAGTTIPQQGDLGATKVTDVPTDLPGPPEAPPAPSATPETYVPPPEEPAPPAAPAEEPVAEGPQAPAEGPQAPAGPEAPPGATDLPPPTGPPADTVTPAPVPASEPPQPTDTTDLPPPSGPPQDTVTPAPVPAAEEPEPQAPARVSLHVQIDIEAGVATIELDEGADRVTLTREGGRWVLGS